MARKHLAQVASAAVPIITITLLLQPALVLANGGGVMQPDCQRSCNATALHTLATVPPQPLQVARE